jgi:hypothetical protein
MSASPFRKDDPNLSSAHAYGSLNNYVTLLLPSTLPSQRMKIHPDNEFSLFDLSYELCDKIHNHFL